MPRRRASSAVDYDDDIGRHLLVSFRVFRGAILDENLKRRTIFFFERNNQRLSFIFIYSYEHHLNITVKIYKDLSNYALTITSLRKRRSF